MNADPLKELLSHLALGPVRTLDQLANEMNVGQELLEQMLLQLEQAGYVRALRACCDLACEGCGSQGLCRLIHSGRAWTITPKGTEAATAP
ncbi:MAG: hypothetical protein A2Y73_05185 [Chloroflexi bacterium RBG_13_56_8]|nr:MAG: hypothetical protein A2Y73_05185 [Chloroflexi bacterium RBG_13_56_8]